MLNYCCYKICYQIKKLLLISFILVFFFYLNDIILFLIAIVSLNV